ncbi:uncharacterized protein [Rutidosis leptorrhynchoides]|uniref:uncharacterized protein n=1 Tax=Rutidosis leptorrhynchoides TaxID=125765 RepID=UPI003A99B90D
MRRKFDKEEYLQRAKDRQEKELERFKSKCPPVQRKPLKHRDYEVDLDSRPGKTQVVTPIAPLSQQPSFAKVKILIHYFLDFNWIW